MNKLFEILEICCANFHEKQKSHKVRAICICKYKYLLQKWTFCLDSVSPNNYLLSIVQPNFVKKKNVSTKYSFFLCISTAKHSSSIEKQAGLQFFIWQKIDIHILDILFRQIIMFIKVPVTFVFGLQTL